MKMKLTVTLAALALAVGWGVKVLAADDPWAANRFFGGSYDGYDANTLIQTDTNAFDCAYARFTGGSFDGWDICAVAGVKLLKAKSITTNLP